MYPIVKRCIDIVGAVLGLTMLSPVLLIVAIAICFQMGTPVFFRQARAGLHGRPFNVIKFRTMTNELDVYSKLGSDEQRLTHLGALMRKSSLDELPQLWNVLKGDMSLVGPRPLYVSYMPYYTERETHRHDVRPGITGLAQVSGRNKVPWDDRLELDVEYVEKQSLGMDLKILLKTINQVVTAKDVVVMPGSLQGPLTACRHSVDCGGNEND